MSLPLASGTTPAAQVSNCGIRLQHAAERTMQRKRWDLRFCVPTALCLQPEQTRAAAASQATPPSMIQTPETGPRVRTFRPI